MKLDLYNNKGEKTGSVSVSASLFDAPFNEGLVHQALLRQQSNSRSPIAKTKTRGEVRGGGKKPWKQKGTGRARTGSIRNPLWRGGGTIFGPTGNENFEVAMPKKQRRIALCSALSEKARHNEVIALEGYDAKEIKTKLFADIVAKLPVERSVLFVTPVFDEIAHKSSRNIPNVRVITAPYINISDILKYKYIVVMKDAVPVLEETFSYK